MLVGTGGYRLGLGVSALGGLYSEVTRGAALDTVAAAWNCGIRHFDAAPLYGSGLAELRLGEGLAGRPRDEYTVSTKVGIRLEPGRPNPLYGEPPLGPVFDFSPDGIRRTHEESLQRLRLDRVDLLLLHDPDEHVEEGLRALDTMRALAPAVGVGTNSVETATVFVETGEVDVVLLAGRHTLLDRAASDALLPLCAERGVPVIAGGVFNSGLLAGGATFHYTAAAPEVVARKDALEQICARHGVPLTAAALQFPLRHPAVGSVVVGARSAAEIEEDVRLFDLPIPDALWAELDLAPVS
jgi:D-threo-aldose 1-dehydrogenase